MSRSPQSYLISTIRRIPVSKGKYEALVDEQDYERLTAHTWFLYRHHGTNYAAREDRKPDGRRTLIKMHREVLQVTDPTKQVDHLNGDGFDNRRQNLRLATPVEQRFNSKVRKDNKTGVTGVFFRCDGGVFLAYAGRVLLGRFKTKEEAIETRKNWEKSSGHTFRRD